MKKLLIGVMSAVLLMPAISYADNNDRDDRIEQAMRADPAYQTKVQEATTKLKKRGYQVMKVEADGHRGKKTLEVEALKDGQEYNIRLAYPSLRILREKLDD